MSQLPFIADAGNNAKASANIARIEADRVAGGRHYEPGTRVLVRWHDGAPEIETTVVQTITTALYGNLIVCEVGGFTRRVVASRVKKRKK